MSHAEAAVSRRGQGMTQDERFVVAASSTGTVFEWYDFYLYATLAPFFAALFFPAGNDTAALLSAFATYAAGFLVRPFGAIFFGRIGDLVGRKYTFLVTILVMGISTFAVGLLPTYATVGWLAPLLLVGLRLLQGLALGGEYGGAATYVAEHAQHGRRGYATSWIQTTATLGFFLSLVVIGLCRWGMDATVFKEWGWRIPFLVSVFLLIFSVYIRLKLNESPVFQKMKAEGKGSSSPLTDSFLRYPNNKYVLLALIGATAGQGVVWYTGQFYALFYMTTVLKISYVTVYIIMMVALTAAAPFFIVFGALSDRIGRRNIMTAGFALAVVSFWPAFTLLGTFKDNPVVLTIIVFYLVILVTMVYGPIAAFLVELFPARIRYTSMSLPYHVGNGVFGGLVPAAGASIAALTGVALSGLFYPMAIAAIGVIVSLSFLREPYHEVKIWDEVGGGTPPLVPDQP